MNAEILCLPHQPVDAIRRHLRLGSCPPSDSRFEILRAAVWSITGPSGRAHVSRIISSALPSWELLSERTTTSQEMLRAELRDALAALEDSGDFIAVKGGHWAPAVTRFVALPQKAGYLLVGGAPSALLDIDEDAIQFQGAHRHLARRPPDLKAIIPLERFDSWINRPKDASLQEWARNIVDSSERMPYIPSLADAFEFYRPESVRLGTPQFFRWSTTTDAINGILLARRRRVFGARDYRLVGVRAGRIIDTCPLHDIDVRRLMYALDLEAKNPVIAQATVIADRRGWLFTSELPRAEQRAFSAFGSLTLDDKRPFERRWTFERNEELALDLVRALGIALGRPAIEER